MFKSIISAFQFLTSLPLPINTGQKHLEKSVKWFPLVGVIVGLCTGYTYKCLHSFLSPNLSAAFTILVYILITRGLHLDGFMDTIDGFFSRKDKKTILSIMKESTVGSFAVLGAGVWFLLLFSVLPFLSPVDHIILHTFTRFFVLLPASFATYPRESGTGKFFIEQVTLPKTFFAFVLVLLTGLGIYFADTTSKPFFFLYGAGLATGAIITIMIALWAQKKIDGITGDVLGFSIEMNHIFLAIQLIILKQFF